LFDLKRSITPSFSASPGPVKKFFLNPVWPVIAGVFIDPRPAPPCESTAAKIGADILQIAPAVKSFLAATVRRGIE
jgi:hypothetical protein